MGSQVTSGLEIQKNPCKKQIKKPLQNGGSNDSYIGYFFLEEKNTEALELPNHSKSFFKDVLYM